MINCKQTAVLPHLGHSSFLADLQKSKFIMVNSFYLKKFHNFQSFNLPSHLFGIDIRLGDGCISTHCDFFDVYDIFCKIQNWSWWFHFTSKIFKILILLRPIFTSKLTGRQAEEEWWWCLDLFWKKFPSNRFFVNFPWKHVYLQFLLL